MARIRTNSLCKVMEHPFSVSLLNDFIFCPASIYFHMVDNDTDKIMYESKEQAEGSALHEKVDNAEYSDRKNILQGIKVFSEHYNIEGKIDIFDSEIGLLTERKRCITKIYDGYVFQLYAYYFALTEMGYEVKKLRFHSMMDNKNYSVPLPFEDNEMFAKFEDTIRDVCSFSFSSFKQTNAKKCDNCVYEPMCSYSVK